MARVCHRRPRISSAERGVSPQKPERPGRRCPNLAAMMETPGTEPAEPAAEPSGWVKFWRWLASLDLTKPPAPVLRWLGVLLVGIVYAAAGTPAPLGDWLWAAILGGLLIFPDIAGFAIGGFRLDLKQAQDGIAKLRQDVNAQARADAKASVGPIIFARDLKDGMDAYKEVLAADQEPQEPYPLRHLDSGNAPEVS